MVKTLVRAVGVVLLLGFLSPVSELRAEEPSPAPTAPLMFRMLVLPMEKPEGAFQESLRNVPPARDVSEWAMLPDGSARYGNSGPRVILKNPCPEGIHPTPVALPGKSRR